MDKREIKVIYGQNPRQMALELLEKVRPEIDIDRTARIGIKPNLVLARPADSGATTSPELVAGIIEYLQSKGLRNISILEGSWVGDRTPRAFKKCGYEDISERYGVPLIDLQRDSATRYKVDGDEYAVCDQVMQLDYLINVPVLKGHCQTGMTCALKNMKGCIPDKEKRRYHTLGLHRPIACLNKIIRQDLIIVDGLMGDLNFEEGGTPVAMNRLIAARDPVLLDSYVARLMGFSLDEVPYIGLAEKLEIGAADLASASIEELNNDKESAALPQLRKNLPYKNMIIERQACSACYGTLIHALERLRFRGELSRIKDKIYIGQHFRGQKSEKGLGIGSCTAGFSRHIKGCPPSAGDIIDLLEDNIH